jgi:putative tryptophan/tyrosine transport system substrate-binding protein
MTNRRAFIAGLGSAAAWPMVARGQQTRKLPTIGFLGATTPSTQKQWTEAFVRRLRELDWTDGQNIEIEYRWAEGRNERAAENFAEFVRLRAEIIVTHSVPLVQAAKRATATIPIVFAVAGDPIGTGLVASLSRPGANVTGMSLQLSDAAGKRVELLRQIIPDLRRLAIMVNIGNPNEMMEMREVQAAAGRFNLASSILEIQRPEDIEPALAAAKGDAGALYVCTDALINTYRAQTNMFALRAQLPTVTGFREFVDAGGLISYGANYPALFRRTAELVDKILRGARAGDIPVEQPSKFDLVVNLKTAKVLGLTVPPMLLATADEVIE